MQQLYSKKENHLFKTYKEFREAHPNISFPLEWKDINDDLLELLGVALVTVLPYSPPEGMKGVPAKDPKVDDAGNYTLGWVYSEMTEDEIHWNAERIIKMRKNNRKEILSDASVTTKAGNVYQVNLASQAALANRILAMKDGETARWIMSDNSIAVVTREELVEAHALAVTEYDKIWLYPYS